MCVCFCVCVCVLVYVQYMGRRTKEVFCTYFTVSNIKIIFGTLLESNILESVHFYGQTVALIR